MSQEGASGQDIPMIPASSEPTRSVYWTRRRILTYIVIPWAFILPIIILHLFVVVYPALQGVYYAFTDWSGIGEAQFVGLGSFDFLKNFAERADFVGVLFRHANVPHAVMAEVQHHAVRAGGDDDAQAAVAEQRPLEKLDGGLVQDNRMVLGAFIGVE